MTLNAAKDRSSEIRVSVIVAARNVGLYIEEALGSLGTQSLQDFELLIVDDGSTDDTRTKVNAAASADSRIQVLTGSGRGPAAARNLAIKQARGRWIAIVDGDDVILPERLNRLVEEGEATSADLVADNLVAFYDDGRPDHPWLSGPAWSKARLITAEDYLLADGDAGSRNRLGYLKPMFRTRCFRDRGLAYDETLFIGEDYDLVARSLLNGAVFRYVPESSYRYRRHAASISHRIEAGQLASIIEGMKRLKASSPATFYAAFDARILELEADLAFVRSAEAIKRGSVLAVVEAVRNPQSRRRLVQAAREGLQRRLRTKPPG